MMLGAWSFDKLRMKGEGFRMKGEGFRMMGRGLRMMVGGARMKSIKMRLPGYPPWRRWQALTAPYYNDIPFPDL